MMPFRQISVFYFLARYQSVARAADELGVTASAVTQQIRVLETQLGMTLVMKKGRGISLTEGGERFYQMIASDVEHIAESVHQVKGGKTPSQLAIRATPSVSTKWLLPRLQQFIDANPMLDIRLDGTSEATDFTRDDIDIEIRHGTGDWPGLFVQPLAEEHFIPVCSPSFAAPFSMKPEEVTGRRLLHSVKSQLTWKMWLARQDLHLEDTQRKIYFDRSYMSVDAAVAGMGIALESVLMMERELREGLLVTPVINAPSMVLRTQWLVCPHHHLRRAKVKLFLDWITHQAELWFSSSQRYRLWI